MDVDTVTLAEALGVPVDHPEDHAGPPGRRPDREPGRGPGPRSGRRRRPSARPGLARGRAPARRPLPRRGLRPRQLRPGRLLARLHGPRAGRVDDGPPRRGEPTGRPRPPRVLRGGGGLVPPAHGRDGGRHGLERRQPGRARPRSRRRCTRSSPSPTSGGSSTRPIAWACPTPSTSAAIRRASSSRMLATGADALELDYKTDVRAALRRDAGTGGVHRQHRSERRPGPRDARARRNPDARAARASSPARPASF
ncbi:MAG: hypothetical protein MZU91_11385 [Desulfosudis oleivorans]|nr:hypothetical protein [Desulfosudis oleivorans]